MRCLILLTFAAPLLSGCAVASVASAPFKGAAGAISAGTTMVDVLTESQAEKDQKRGRTVRQREERMGALEREYYRQGAKCADGDRKACLRRDAAYSEMQALMPSLPYEPPKGR